MILYNVTINIDQNVESDWVHWMKTVHIPDVMATGLFESYKFYKLLHEMEGGGINYSAQYFAKSIEDINIYMEQFAPKLQADVKARYQDKYITFRSLLEEVI